MKIICSIHTLGGEWIDPCPMKTRDEHKSILDSSYFFTKSYQRDLCFLPNTNGEEERRNGKAAFLLGVSFLCPRKAQTAAPSTRRFSPQAHVRGSERPLRL